MLNKVSSKNTTAIKLRKTGKSNYTFTYDALVNQGFILTYCEHFMYETELDCRRPIK